MNIVGLLKLILSLASTLAEYAKNKQLMDAGASEAILKGVRDADDAIRRADSARNNADNISPVIDPNNRDNLL